MELSGIYTIHLDRKEDSRGYFMRTFCSNEVQQAHIPFTLLQINQSLTKSKGTIRGLHFQKKPQSEKKIIHCLQGEIFDVVININPQSKDYGKYFTITLAQHKNTLLYISEDYAHGFQALTDTCIVQYLMDEYYSPEHAAGILWNDPTLSIPWPLPLTEISEKDQLLPLFTTI